MAGKKILYITSGIFPYMPEDYITSICRYLPQGMQERDNGIRTFMPKFGCVNDNHFMLHEVIRLSGQNIIIEDTDHPLIIKVASIQNIRMQIYFIDNEDFFKRKQPYYDGNGMFYADNDSRAIFYAKGVMETVRKLGWEPHIVHCLGWISALVPMLVKTIYKDNPLFQGTKIVYTIMPDYFPEKFSSVFSKKLRLTDIPREHLKHFRTPTYNAIIQNAIDFSDAIVTTHDHNKKLMTYLEKSGKKILKHPEDEYIIDVYDEFYDQLLADTPEEA